MLGGGARIDAVRDAVLNTSDEAFTFSCAFNLIIHAGRILTHQASLGDIAGCGIGSRKQGLCRGGDLRWRCKLAGSVFSHDLNAGCLAPFRARLAYPEALNPLTADFVDYGVAVCTQHFTLVYDAVDISVLSIALNCT
ncbi:hypothetical protein D3C72_1361490 [compost metagenome]